MKCKVCLLLNPKCPNFPAGSIGILRRHSDLHRSQIAFTDEISGEEMMEKCFPSSLKNIVWTRKNSRRPVFEQRTKKPVHRRTARTAQSPMTTRNAPHPQPSSQKCRIIIDSPRDMDATKPSASRGCRAGNEFIQACTAVMKRFRDSSTTIPCNLCKQQVTVVYKHSGYTKFRYALNHVLDEHSQLECFTCKLCPRKFRTKIGVNSHILTTHKQSAVDKYVDGTLEHQDAIYGLFLQCFGGKTVKESEAASPNLPALSNVETKEPDRKRSHSPRPQPNPSLKAVGIDSHPFPEKRAESRPESREECSGAKSSTKTEENNNAASGVENGNEPKLDRMLMQHMTTGFKCDQCGFMTKWEMLMKRHVEVKHSE